MSDPLSRKYHHPYEPYPIQLEFMNALNELLTNDQYKIGLFESPTGTGKTLSLICSSMSWLRNVETEINTGVRSVNCGDSVSKDAASKFESDHDSDSEPEWVKQSFNKMKVKVFNDKAEAYERKLNELSKSRINVISEDRLVGSGRDLKRRKKVAKIEVEIAEDDDQQFAPMDYHSDSEERTEATAIDRNSELNGEVQTLLRQYNERIKPTDTNSLKQEIKIIFASRTHSQLSQFSSQLRLPDFPSSLPSSADKIKQHLKYAPLGSRKQLCIHEKVSNLKDVALINEACLDLQKETEPVKRCSYHFANNDPVKQERSMEFRDRLFMHIHDIEDLPQLGKDLGVCPYYSSRKAIDLAEVITMPYQLLLSSAARESIGLDLKNSIVIIDEAHNLIDTITSIFSVSVHLEEFLQCRDSLKTYYMKFNKRMNGGNRVNLLKLIKLVNLVCEYTMTRAQKIKIKNGDVININEMFDKTTGDLLNVNKLDRYLTTSKIGYKIQGYIDKLEREKQPEELKSKSKSSTPVLFKVIEFLKAIANPSSEGKFFFENTSTSSATSNLTLNYMLLDPSHKFKDIVDQSQRVILAGGTMEPMSDFTNYLFPYINSERQILKFQCDHIIPEENLSVFPIVEHQGEKFQFTFTRRKDIKMINKLGDYIIKLAAGVPRGMVVFVPSYKYLQDIIEIWKKSDIFQVLNSVKNVHFEKQSSNTSELLTAYSKDIELNSRGAILFSVVGGKLSEGINFNDNLARSVLIIGLPYPNLFSGEIINKRKYIYSQTMKETNGDTQKAERAMKEFYENLCMKAVNQCIGRSIRHIADYCVIYLIDERYKNVDVQGKLSKWIRDRIDCDDDQSLGVLQKTKMFFQRKRS
ncbi:hypothetical protein WICPIJ_006061 [Wickerhamomyces pijperi]|uniref:ATP-dependent DNA helicase CHL1 n=1 Tax=Wickerhamomyces pijperi TaxID=599730 RepID=A0A9P8Q500_WICPI|nr:hypothetical protein WICPIJ_006061 [Wickerhamomyces pijperi]